MNSNIILGAIYASKVSTGMAMSIWGPTLLAISENIGVDIATVSLLYTFQNLGILTGGTFGGYVGNSNRLYSFSIGILFLALGMSGIPFATTMWLLFILAFIEGFSYGFLNSTMQATILKVWGVKRSRSLIAAFHFMFALGAVVTPLIVRVFDNGQSAETCSNYDSEATTKFYNFTLDTSSTTKYPKGSDNYIVYPYLICASYTLLCSLLCLGLGLARVDRNL